MIYKRPNIKNISTTLLLSLLWGTTLSSAAEQQLITQDNALGTQHANLPAQGTHHIAANWGEFFAAYQPNMLITHNYENGKVFLYQGASLQAELQVEPYNYIKALYPQPDHSVIVWKYDGLHYVQANGIILDNIQSGLSVIFDLCPQPDGSFIMWGTVAADAHKLLQGRPGGNSLKEIETGLSYINGIHPEPDGSLYVWGKDAAGAKKLVHGRPGGNSWKEINAGLSYYCDIHPQPDGSLIVRGQDYAAAYKLVHGRPDGTKCKEINMGLMDIFNVYPQQDGSLIVDVHDFDGIRKIVHGQPYEAKWQEIKTGLMDIDRVYPQPDGSIIAWGKDEEYAAKLVHCRPGGNSWKDINTGLTIVYYIYQQLDGSLHLSGKDAAGGQAAKYISPDGQVQQLLGHRIVKVHGFLSAEPYINDTLPNLITAKDELDTESLQYLCEKLAKFRQKPKDALLLFTKLHEKLHTHFHGPLQSDDLALPLSNKIGEDAYRAQQNLLTDTIADLRQKYESTWLSPYLDALYLEYSGIRDLVYTAKEGFKPLTLDGIKAESAGLSEEDPMHYKNRWDATLLADDILKNISDHAKELMQESDFKELYQHIRLAVEQLEQKPTASAPATPDASLSHTG